MKRIAFDHADAARRYGIHFMAGIQAEASGMQLFDRSLALDAQPQLVTQANAGVPSLFTTYVDPAQIEVLVSPTKAAVLYGETKYGTWVVDTSMFPVVERTGETESYGDYSQGGMANSNENWVSRQSYHFQVNTRWGQRELERAAEARIDRAANINKASALAITKFQNLSYLYGISNLQCYGGTNDPALPAPIAPTSSWFGADATVIYGDVLRLVQQMIAQGDGLVDAETKFNLGISPGNVTNFNNTNQYNVNVYTQIKTNFPNLSIVTIPEFAINGGGGEGGTELVQLIAPMVEGQETVVSAFTEKMRAHAVVTKSSSWEQKKSAGTWGTIIKYPAFIATMLGE
jgi:hypothetical protein